MYDLIIIGAGTAGLSAAINIGLRKPDSKILILERQNRSGRKLSASGNGKCNITNEFWSEECYHSDNKTFVSEFVNRHSPAEVISFFDKCGIPSYENNGYYYPLSNQAKQVTEKLLDICCRLGIEINNESDVSSVIPLDNGYKIISDKEYFSKFVIIAAGSNAWNKLGGCESGYKLAEKLSLKLTNIYPGLTPIYVNDKQLSIAKGVRINGSVSLHIDTFSVKESGQIQVNEDNLSGIAIMNLSLHLPSFNQDKYECALWIDVIPTITWERLKDYINLQCRTQKNEMIGVMLMGLLPAPFVKYILKRVNINDHVLIGSLTEKQINRITSILKKLTFTPVEKKEFEKAQASLGGISTEEINCKSFELIRYPKMYAIGEILDMTGKCGGYNISFAVLSGMDAADSIVSQMK